jgi:hypothetical protein
MGSGWLNEQDPVGIGGVSKTAPLFPPVNPTRMPPSPPINRSAALAPNLLGQDAIEGSWRPAALNVS